jgi:hypothetical protein
VWWLARRTRRQQQQQQQQQRPRPPASRRPRAHAATAAARLQRPLEARLARPPTCACTEMGRGRPGLSAGVCVCVCVCVCARAVWRPGLWLCRRAQLRAPGGVQGRACVDGHQRCACSCRCAWTCCAQGPAAAHHCSGAKAAGLACGRG